MPNWCECSLQVSGPTKEVKAFVKKAKHKATSDDDDKYSELSMNNFIPMPKNLLDGEGWYEWRLKNWGCKWDLSNAQKVFVSRESSTTGEMMVEYIFESPWSPPNKFIEQVAKMYPLLLFTLKYKEPGMCFQGTIVAQGDDYFDNEEEYVPDDEDDEEDNEEDNEEDIVKLV